MKPKNAYQRHIVELSKKLPAITDKQKQWAFEHCFDKIGFLSKGFVWCTHCGHQFSHSISPLSTTILKETAVCPQCGELLNIHHSRKQKHNEKWYYTILTTFEGFQVCRHFIAEKTIYKVSEHIEGCSEPYFSIHEAVQNWIDDNGKETIIARPCKPLIYCYDYWDFAKPMEIRSTSYKDKYNISAYYIYPHKRLLPILKRNGFRVINIAPNILCRMIIKDRESECLIKAHQDSLLTFKHIRGYRQLPHRHAIRIAIRHNYIVKDASMWIDYLNLLEYFHLDTHNAHYVCPRNLKAEHDRLLVRKQRIEEKIALEKKIAEAKKWEAKYQETKGKFFGICFGNENIVITVIQSVAEMAEEGKAMHHCVYSMEYYKKPNSLILSAKDKAGNRIETIEIDLKTFKVVQSRGVCNKNTEQHDEIVKLVQDNIKLIKQAA
jgi:hypothetical protein